MRNVDYCQEEVPLSQPKSICVSDVYAYACKSNLYPFFIGIPCHDSSRVADHNSFEVRTVSLRAVSDEHTFTYMLLYLFVVCTPCY